jgi:glycosyltransferase involved in cell wall biosynthesis
MVLILGSFAPSLVNFRGPLIQTLIARGHRVIAAAPSISPAIADQLRQMGAEVRELTLSKDNLSPIAMVRSYRQLRQLIRACRPDTIISYTIKPVILGALAGRKEKVPTIVSLITGAGYAFTDGRETRRLVSRVAASLLYRVALRLSDTVIFQNPDDEKLFRRLRLMSPGQRSFWVNGSGIDLDRFSPMALPAMPSFLMIARLLKDKGIREFATAARRLKAKHPDVPVILVGYLDTSPDSFTIQELDELVQHGIEYRGRLDDVRPAIADCSIYVLPSYREGTPRTVLEAMAMGRPVITSDAPGCRETVRHGVNGFLVPPRDADALYKAMLRFIRDPGLIGQMGTQSRRIAEEKYDVHRVNADILTYAGL